MPTTSPCGPVLPDPLESPVLFTSQRNFYLASLDEGLSASFRRARHRSCIATVNS